MNQTNALTALLAEAQAIVSPYLQRGGYALVYGSHATATARPTSDLDLLIVSGTHLSATAKQRLIADVIALHHDHGLDLDTEVAYDVKLHATTAATRHAVSLSAFTTRTGGLHVPVVDDSPAFLNSPQFKWRLILGALTSPHIFLCGNLDAYRRDTTAADLAIGLTITTLLAPRTTFTTTQATDVLLHHPSGACGKSHLGYLHPGPTWALAQRALGALDRHRAVEHSGTDTWRLHPRRRDQLVDALIHNDATHPGLRILTETTS